MATRSRPVRRPTVRRRIAPHFSAIGRQRLLGELLEPLTEREVELLALVADGLSNAEIAECLYLSPQTVKVHVRNIFAKLGASSRTQAVATARELSLLGR
ncbi:MAG TPA: response regulator transcription factor [Candidatus Limnocylindrales bacterium]